MSQLSRAWFFLAVVIGSGCAAPSARPSETLTRAPSVIGEREPHAHLSLVTVPRPEAAAGAIEIHVNDLRQPAFLKTLGTASRNPFAPCALVAAGVTSAHLDAYWDQAIQGGVAIRPGTNLLGKFDDHLRHGRIPRDDPAQTSEIVARLFIWSSWGRDGTANTLIESLTQQQCLELLFSSPRALAVKVGSLGTAVTSHSAAVSHYSGILPREETERFLAELGERRFSARPARGTDNPLAPCSLLRALVLAGHLSAVWAKVMSVSEPRVQADPHAAAEAAARLFAGAMREAAAANELVVEAATQEDCLNAMFQRKTS